MEKAERALGRRKSRKSPTPFLETLDADLNFCPKNGRQLYALHKVRQGLGCGFSISRRTAQKVGNLAVCFDMKGRLFVKLF